MSDHIHPIKSKSGAPPGTLIHVGEISEEKVKISAISYSKDKFSHTEIEQPEEIKDLLNTDMISWINVDGVHNPEIIREIGAQFNLHSLVMEDITVSRRR